MRQEYELVDQSHNRARVEAGGEDQRGREPPSPPSPPRGSRGSRTRSRSSSPSSRSSSLFARIEAAAGAAGAADTFEEEAAFQKVWRRYERGAGGAVGAWMQRWRRSVWAAVGVAGVLLWVAGVAAYSGGRGALRAAPHAAVAGTAGLNVTLNPYSAANDNVTMAGLYAGRWAPQWAEVEWLGAAQYPRARRGGGGGFYLTRDASGTVLRQAGSDYAAAVVGRRFAYGNDFFEVARVIANPARPIDEAEWHVVVTDVAPQWRHSSLALYWVWSVHTNDFAPLQPPVAAAAAASPHARTQAGALYKLHYAAFSPRGTHILLAFDHNLYLYDCAAGATVDAGAPGPVARAATALTSSGSAAVFHGKPDWVYEEEVAGSDRMAWWSPDSRRVVYATLNDTRVGAVELAYYVGDAPEVDQYPRTTSLRYPKPGTANPAVALHCYDTEDGSTTEILAGDLLLYAVQWLDSDALLLKTSDRASKRLARRMWAPSTRQMAGAHGAAREGDWAASAAAVAVVPDGARAGGYVDLVAVDDQPHLAFFARDAAPRVLTRAAAWGVLDGAAFALDSVRRCVYFVATRRSSMDAHLMAVDLEGAVRELTPASRDGLYEAAFSPDAQYVDLRYTGPHAPWQRLVNMGALADAEDAPDAFIEAQPPLSSMTKALAHTNTPTKVYRQIAVDGLLLDVVEILPPNFDPRRFRYPVLAAVYGGPGSKLATKRFRVDFEEVACATLNCIVLLIDPRGTGNSWRSRRWAAGRLGHWEPRDVVAVTQRYVAANAFVDAERVALWGWSYGGYVALKTLEYDGGAVFKYAMAVAPVTNWLFYDSVYVERVMGAPGPSYDASRVDNVARLAGARRFLVMHGTADDNVHIQNSYWLLDRLDLFGVENYDVHFFPDSDHSISYHRASVVVYDKLLHWLSDAFAGRFDDRE
ncbi:Dipeptidyl aminopeptidase A [[Candida] zeylanoides]